MARRGWLLVVLPLLTLTVTGVGCQVLPGAKAPPSAAGVSGVRSSETALGGGTSPPAAASQAPGRETVSAERQDVTLTVTSDGFEPAETHLKVNHPYRLLIKAAAGTEHVVRIPEFLITAVVNSPGGVQYDVEPPRTGSFDVFCATHAKEKGKIIVE